jgi:hypothetical protein
MVTATPATDGRTAADLHGLLTATAATGLRRHTAGTRLDDATAAAWLRAVDQDRLTGHAVRAVAAGDIVVSEAAGQAVSRLHRRRTMQVLELELTLVRVCDMLDRAGVAYRVLKGPALGRTVYASADMRSFVDVDVLVPTHDIDRATAVLAEAGYARVLPELRPGFDRRFGKGVMLVDERRCHVDLHRTLAIGPFGLTIDTDDLFRTQQVVSVAGRELRALGAEEQFLNVCYHAALGDVPPRLSVLRDVAETVLRTSLDARRVLVLARRWGGEIVVARALRLAWTLLAPDDDAPLVRWAFGHRPRRQQRWLLACYVSARRTNSWKYLSSVAVIRGTGAKLAYLRALLAPQRGFVRRRARDRARWLLHGASGLWRSANDVGIEQS